MTNSVFSNLTNFITEKSEVIHVYAGGNSNT